MQIPGGEPEEKIYFARLGASGRVETGATTVREPQRSISLENRGVLELPGVAPGKDHVGRYRMVGMHGRILDRETFEVQAGETKAIAIPTPHRCERTPEER